MAAGIKTYVIGDTYKYLTIISDAPSRTGRRMVKCICVCGKYVVADLAAIRGGNTNSCGCYKQQRILETHVTHGHATVLGKNPVYSIWLGMRDRCRNPNNGRFLDYGGRGITVCKRWNKFENFLADMGDRPSKRHSIDRINNDRGYMPSNCRWATPLQQQANTRKAIKTAEGSLRQTAILYGVAEGSLYYYVRKKGIPLKRALIYLKTRTNPRIRYKG